MSEQEAEIAEEATEDEGKVSIKVDPEKYVSTKSASGKKSQRRDDGTAIALDGLTLEAVHQVGTEVLEEDFIAKYGHLNPGMQRMNVGNRLRAWVNKAPEGEDRNATLATYCEPHKPEPVPEKEEEASE